jgi:hypothetical protein
MCTLDLKSKVLNLKREHPKLGVVVYAFNPNTWEAEVGLQVPGQPGQDRDPVKKNQTETNK